MRPLMKLSFHSRQPNDTAGKGAHWLFWPKREGPSRRTLAPNRERTATVTLARPKKEASLLSWMFTDGMLRCRADGMPPIVSASLPSPDTENEALFPRNCSYE